MKLGLGLGIDMGGGINKQEFISVWKTDNTSVGSSNNNQVKLPLEAGGIYNFTVDWGDGNKNTITAWNQAETTHTYAAIGTYTIRIVGIINGFRFNNSGDRLKLLTINNKNPNFLLGNNNGYFYGCSNLTEVNGLNTQNTTNMANMFVYCTKLNQDLTFNTENVTNMSSMFEVCTIFNKNLNFNTQNVTDMAYMFQECPAFNKSLNFNTQKVKNMTNMFQGCTNFNQNIANFSLIETTNMTSILLNAVNWSRVNYDLFLVGAHNQGLTTGIKDNVSFRCSSQYTLGGAAEAARTYLIGTKGWIITDLGGI